MSEVQRFGDGVAFPKSAIKPFVSGVPSLDTFRDLALQARSRGSDVVDVPISGDNRQYALQVVLYGLRGIVVRRWREIPTVEDLKNGRLVDSGAITQLLVRFPIIDVLLAHKRETFRLGNTSSTRLSVNRKRRRLIRNVSIR
jgi:hypothetical protein